MITKEQIARLRQLHAEAAKGIVFEPDVPILANAGLARFNKAQLTEAALSALPDLLDAAERCEVGEHATEQNLKHIGVLQERCARLEAALRGAQTALRELSATRARFIIDAALEGK